MGLIVKFLLTSPFFCLSFISHFLPDRSSPCFSLVTTSGQYRQPSRHLSQLSGHFFFSFFFFFKAKVRSRNESEGNLEANSFDIRTGTDSAEFSRAVLCSEAKS